VLVQWIRAGMMLRAADSARIAALRVCEGVLAEATPWHASESRRHPIRRQVIEGDANRYMERGGNQTEC